MGSLCGIQQHCQHFFLHINKLQKLITIRVVCPKHQPSLVLVSQVLHVAVGPEGLVKVGGAVERGG